jgi:hypothetical protein
MDDLLMILIDAMRTVDGNKDSLDVAEKHLLNVKRKMLRQGMHESFNSAKDHYRITLQEKT